MRRAIGALSIVASLLVAALAVGPARPAQAESDQELVRAILRTGDRDEREEAAKALADQLDPAPIRRIAAVADESRRAASALALIEQRVAKRIARERKPATRLRAIKVLGVIDTEPSAEDLAELVVESSKRKVRDAAASALGGLEDSGPLVVDTLLEASLSSFDEPARQASIERAVAAIGPEASEPLLAAFGADYDTRLLVIQLLHAVEREHPSSLDTVWPRVVEDLVGRIGRSGTEDIAGMLADVGSPAVPRLIEIARQPSGPAGPFEDPPSVAQQALILMAERDRSLISPLDEALERRDYSLIVDLMQFYISLGKPGSEAVLTAALESLGDTDEATIIVLQFLNSGHQPLIDAAYSWARRHGYTISGEPSGTVTWGTIQVAPEP